MNLDTNHTILSHLGATSHQLRVREPPRRSRILVRRATAHLLVPGTSTTKLLALRLLRPRDRRTRASTSRSTMRETLEPLATSVPGPPSSLVLGMALLAAGLTL